MKGALVNNTDTANREISIKIGVFSVITENPDEFIEDLEILCKKFCLEGRYFFTYRFED